jgi:hypothetical protein
VIQCPAPLYRELAVRPLVPFSICVSCGRKAVHGDKQRIAAVLPTDPVMGKTAGFCC